MNIKLKTLVFSTFLPFSVLAVDYSYDDITNKNNFTLDLSNFPNPDIENTMLAQVLDAPRKREKTLITNEVNTFFSSFLCTSITCTIKRISISGFG